VEVDMSTTTNEKTAIPAGLDARVLSRVLEEGYGPGAWHGSDFKAAIGDVGSELAVWRPAPERHNIAEIALHHAYCVRAVRGRLGGAALEPFILEGDDWFEVKGKGGPSWRDIQAVVESEQERLARLVADLAAGRTRSPLPEAERFDVVLGVACHAVYHAGQVQLIKRLHAT
jgi:hypothetical protein